VTNFHTYKNVFHFALACVETLGVCPYASSIWTERHTFFNNETVLPAWSRFSFAVEIDMSFGKAHFKLQYFSLFIDWFSLGLGKQKFPGQFGKV
jgi:hypothetical protein